MLRRTPLKSKSTGLSRKPMKASGTPKGRRNAGLKRGSKAAKDYMGRVAESGCIVCRIMGYGKTPAQVHHQKEGAGIGCRAAEEDTIGLCVEHHTGTTGIHQIKSHGFKERYGYTERELVEMTQKELGYKAGDN